VPRAPRLHAAAHGRCQWCCKQRGLPAARCGGSFGASHCYNVAGWRGSKKGGEGLEKGLATGISQLFLGRWREGPGWPREDARAVRADANSAQICAKDGSRRMRRSGCVAPLGRAHATPRSGQTSSDARGRDALARWRCPNRLDLKP
jgi:hypothetical protein